MVAWCGCDAKQKAPVRGTGTGAFDGDEGLELLCVFHFLLLVRAVTAQERGQVL
jgi:hypothetical protein